MEASYDSPIKDYFRNKTVFLTGGFGFVGKLLIEKLLRCNVKKIFVMARSKKGRSIEERFENLLKDVIFSKSTKDDLMKLHLIEGDLQKSQLGITQYDERALINEVEIFYHAAADVRFDENLKEAIETNVKGTLEVINLAKKLINLNVFIYVSTAFATPSFYVEEKFYDTVFDADMMIKYVENLKDSNEIEHFEILARRIIQPFPNTYTFTKALAEQIIRKYAKNLNCAIVRPSIITATYREPYGLEGYTDNVYGLNGVLVGAGSGVLRILRIDNKLKSNIVPADYVVNLIMALSLYTLTRENNFNFIRYCSNTNAASNEQHSNHVNGAHQHYLNETDMGDDDKIKVYNFSASNENHVTWMDVKRISTRYGHKFSMNRRLWIITYNTTRYHFIAQFLRIIYHFIPALFFDAMLMFNSKKPKLLKLYRKVNKFAEVLEFFTNNQWHFDDANVVRLWNQMTRDDKKLFNFDIWSIEWEDFFNVYVKGLRRYICNESLDSLDDARQRYRRLAIIHYAMLFTIYAIFSYFLYQILQSYGILDGISENFIYQTKYMFLKSA